MSNFGFLGFGHCPDSALQNRGSSIRPANRENLLAQQFAVSDVRGIRN